ncbi:DUF6221 family protein [Streptomyces sp. NPDC127117]|uniref:DUF6221 family protein n=1 Tax=Streptomyces sp. NPDC127117 TaxID=3345368 RepID=UPI003635D3EE
MDDLVLLLRDRLDQHETVTRAVGVGEPDGLRWLAHGSGSGLVSDGVGMVVTHESGAGGRHATHIARHDPARALREAEAERGLLKRYEAPETSAVPPDPISEFTGGVERMVLVEVFRRSALPHAEHPDYQEGRRPWASGPAPLHDDGEMEALLSPEAARALRDRLDEALRSR